MRWNIDFYKNRKVFFIISAVIVAVMLIGMFTIGVDRDIQFKGGVLLTYSYTGEVSADEFKATAQDILGGDIAIQESTDLATGKQNFVISKASVEGISAEIQSNLNDVLSEKYAANEMELVSSNIVDPTIGSEFFSKSIVAVGFAAILMLVYVGIRFRKISGWSAGLASVVALCHDLVVVLTAFIWFGFSINANFVAVCLTILGYSLNDTIVIFDRIRENKRLMGSAPIEELVNRSVNQSFARSLMTSVTTCSAMLVVSIVAYVFNVSSILSFSVPMFAGMVSGFYSSVCIAPMLWTVWQKKKAA